MTALFNSGHRYENNRIHIYVGNPTWTEDEVNELWNPPVLDVVRTDDRFLPKILIDLGWAESSSEVRRNQKHLFTAFPDDHEYFYEIRYGADHFPRTALLIVGIK